MGELIHKAVEWILKWNVRLEKSIVLSTKIENNIYLKGQIISNNGKILSVSSLATSPSPLPTTTTEGTKSHCIKQAIEIIIKIGKQTSYNISLFHELISCKSESS